LKKQKEALVKEREDKLDEIQASRTDELAAITLEKELDQGEPGYEKEKERIGTKNGVEELKALNQLESNTIQSISKELQSLDAKSDPVSEKRKEVLKELKGQFEENIAGRNEEIKNLTTTASTN